LQNVKNRQSKIYSNKIKQQTNKNKNDNIDYNYLLVKNINWNKKTKKAKKNNLFIQITKYILIAYYDSILYLVLLLTSCVADLLLPTERLLMDFQYIG